MGLGQGFGALGDWCGDSEGKWGDDWILLGGFFCSVRKLAARPGALFCPLWGTQKGVPTSISPRKTPLCWVLTS